MKFLEKISLIRLDLDQLPGNRDISTIFLLQYFLTCPGHPFPYSGGLWLQVCEKIYHEGNMKVDASPSRH
jgi:hypothetical protein